MWHKKFYFVFRKISKLSLPLRQCSELTYSDWRMLHFQNIFLPLVNLPDFIMNKTAWSQNFLNNSCVKDYNTIWDHDHFSKRLISLMKPVICRFPNYQDFNMRKLAKLYQTYLHKIDNSKSICYIRPCVCYSKIKPLCIFCCV